MNKPLAAAAVAAALATPLAAQAFDLDSLQQLNQAQFRLLSEDLGAVLSYKPLTPAEPLGVSGLDLGLAVTGTDLKNSQVLRLAASGKDVPTLLPLPTLRLHKGLPLNIDIGAQYAAVPGSNIKLWGGELRWAIIGGGTLMPAIAVRGAYTRLQGVDQLKVETRSADVSISKGFAMLTPYAGVGQVWITSTPQGVPTLREEDFTATKAYVGVNINLGVNLVIEADSTAGVVSYGAKLGFRF